MDIDIEKSIVAEIWRGEGYPIGWGKLVQQVKGKMFRNIRLGKVYDLIVGGKRDIPAIAKESGMTASSLVGIIEKDSGIIGVETIQEFIAGYYKKRAVEIAQQEADLESIQGQIQDLIIERDEVETGQRATLEDYASYIHDRSAIAEQTGLLGATTGWDKLDKYQMGFPLGRIWILGGYSGSGKTFFMLNLALNLAKNGKSVAIFSYEQSSNELMDRLIAMEGGLTPVQLFSNLKKELHEVRQSARQLIGGLIKDERLILYDQPLTRQALDIEVAKLSVDYVMFDYLQLIPGEARTNYDLLRENSFAIQRIAKEHNVGVLILSQLSNEAHLAGDSYEAFGFKGSGDIAQIADLAIRLQRKRNEDGKMSELYRLRILKNRHGEQGDVNFKLEFPGGRIVETNQKIEETTVDNIFKQIKNDQTNN